MGAAGWSPGQVRLDPSQPLDLPRTWHLPPSASSVQLFFPNFASSLPTCPSLWKSSRLSFCLFVSDLHDLLSPLPSSSFSFLSPCWSLRVCVFLSPSLSVSLPPFSLSALSLHPLPSQSHQVCKQELPQGGRLGAPGAHSSKRP